MGEKETKSPPKLFLRFFRWFCHPKMLDYIEGDLMEVYRRRLIQTRKRKADVKFIIDVLLLFRPGIVRLAGSSNNLINYGMFKSYFKTAWRNLLRGKMHSSINILGLAMGMTVAILVGLWISDELSFDSSFQNHSRLGEVLLNQTDNGIIHTGVTISPVIAGPLRSGYGNDLKSVSLVSWNNAHVLANGQKKLLGNGRWVERSFGEMFSLSMVHGLHNSLSDPSTMLLSESLAVALFGNDNPQNKMIRVDNELDMTVGGVYEDFPSNTTFFGTQFLLPWDNQANWMTTVTDWDNHSCQLFVQLTDEADVNQVNEKIKNLPTPYVEGWKEEIMIQPLDRLHLYSEFENGIEAGGRIEFVWLFGIIGAFVLFLASINFMNLSTARSEKRAREVGIRKAVGSVRGQLVSQFLIESVMVSTAAVILSLVLAQLSLPFFADMADKKILIPWENVTFWIMVAGFTLIVGIISGSYPALYLSSFKPIKALKGAIRAGNLAVVPRKALVVIQFTVSITLVIGTLVVFRQINFAKDRLAGYSRHGLITVPTNTDIQRHYDAIQNDLLQGGAVENIAASSQSPAHFGNNTSIEWPGKREDQSAIFFRNVTVTSEFGETVGWTIKSGRDFSRDFATDSSAVVLNEKAIEIMGLPDPIGTQVKYDGQDFTIIGIANDMVTQSPYEPSQPTVFFGTGWLGVIDIRLMPSLSVQESLAKIESVFKKYNPSSPFQYSFVDEAYGRKFRNEEKIGSMANLFALLAIFISCLGLFGLASFVAEQRTKEIGIRKVLGASVLSLWGLLSKDFVALIFLSFIISIPLSLSFLLHWLQQYSYRTTMPWPLFITAGAGAVVLTLMTISYHALRAAVTNPVESLRSE